MADYVDKAYAYLIALSATYRQHYLPGIADSLMRHGKTTRLMPDNKETLNGASLEVEVTTAHNRSTRATKDLMKAIPDAGPGRKTRYTINFDHTDSSANDFVALEIAFHTTWYDIKKKADSNYKHATKDPLREDFEEGMADVKEVFAKYLHLPIDGLLATTHATNAKLNDNNDIYDSAFAGATYTAGSDAALVPLADGSIARVGNGQKIDFYSGSTFVAGPFLVNYVHPFDHTLAVSTIASTDPSGGTMNASGAVTNCDDITTSLSVYLAGNYNEMATGSLAHLFDVTSTYYGRDRTDPLYKQLQPIRINLGTSVDLTDDHFTRAGEVVGWQQGDGNALSPRALVMARDQYRAVKKFGKHAQLNIVPGGATEVSSMLKRVVGEDGFVLHDPNLGQVAFVVDDFAEYGQIDFLDMRTWMALPWGGSGFEMFPGDIGGMWTRNSEDDGSGRPSKKFSANGIMSFAFFNTGAIRNLRLQGLNTGL